MKIKDLRLWNRALSELWPISEEDRKFVIEQSVGIMRTTTDAKIKLMAHKNILLAESQNQKERFGKKEPTIVIQKQDAPDVFGQLIKDSTQDEAMELLKIRARIINRQRALESGTSGPESGRTPEESGPEGMQ